MFVVIASSLLLLYCGVYSLFWYYPNLLFPRKKAALLGKGRKNCKLIAHRGSREEGLPENSLAAFKDAVDQRADVVEFDVWLTADGSVVVHHDETMSRMTQGDCTKKIHELIRDELPELKPEKHQFHRSSSYRKHEVHSIPTLEDVLLTVPSNVHMIIEFKQDNKELIDKVHDLIHSYGRESTVFWFSLLEGINQKLHEKDPSIPIITSIVGMLRILLYYYCGILPFMELREAVFGITVESISLERIRNEKAVKFLPDWIKRVLAFILQGKPPYLMYSPTLFAYLRRCGMPVWFLGINSEEDLKLAHRAGATAVLTDRIGWLSAYCQDNNLVLKSPE